jgi:hypothetical protein
MRPLASRVGRSSIATQQWPRLAWERRKAGMRIVEQTESKMVVRSSSRATLIQGFVLFVFGIAFLTYTSRVPIGLLVSLAFIAGSLVLLMVKRHVLVTVDKLRTTVEVRSRRLLLLVTQRTEAISAVDRVTSDQLYGKRLIESEWGNMILVYKDGSYVVLDREDGRTSSMPGGVMCTVGADRTVEAALARFLGVPLVVNPDFSEALEESKLSRELTRP